mmetsp:Transcript_12301/g.18428  ORF Transcript_12301/g.18428 Transcript_12301/m.18428 type:complete len:117 (+) Transcript_12301:88-438(+)|eukprot:CAMPEP_0171463088 /NCGR_PEP_ID=MMETSP0945-20130129/6875_1 /TAXON_ID=109269 /ORGANISM="Vaucheria litorea, Strain CCMP2940" /LENGTH=116 /DNA_ID=CAMNT_0011989763 /DNA_START=55 /DNA_END=405 /DNA_ORIENTATION=+
MTDVHDEQCTSYAAIALYDGEAEITSEQLKTLINATGNEVKPYWPMLFASLFQKISVQDLLLSTSSGGGGGGGGGGGSAETAAEESKAVVEEKVEEEEEEIDMGGGMDMFGGGGDY